MTLSLKLAFAFLIKPGRNASTHKGYKQTVQEKKRGGQYFPISLEFLLFVCRLGPRNAVDFSKTWDSLCLSVFVFCFILFICRFCLLLRMSPRMDREREKSCILIGTALSANKTFLLVLLFFFAEKLPENSICADVMNINLGMRSDSIRSGPYLFTMNTHTQSL